MTDKRFPLCEKLGLELHRFQLNKTDPVAWSEKMVSARELEKLLENLPVVVGIDDIECGVTSWHQEEFSPTHLKGQMDMKARVLLIEPIKRESAEDLLREIVESKSTVDWLDRAKAFLEREKEREGL